MSVQHLVAHAAKQRHIVGAGDEGGDLDQIADIHAGILQHGGDVLETALHLRRAVTGRERAAARADALATALEVMGPEEGYAAALAHGWAVLLVGRDEDGTLYDRETPAVTQRAEWAEAGKR